jgi:dynein heavy chain
MYEWCVCYFLSDCTGNLSAGTVDTWDNLYSFFLGRVRDKLHVCLCFSPVGAKFSRRAQQFPGLINGCTIDWFLSWPEEALTSVSGKFIDEFPMACPDSVKDSLKAMMGQVHVNVTAACQEYFEKFRRHVYVTPKSYLSFIAGYKSLYEKKLLYVRELATSINSGLSKMGEAKVDVNKMKGELAIKNTDLAAATKEAEKLLKEISENTAIAEKEKQKVRSHHAGLPCADALPLCKSHVYRFFPSICTGRVTRSGLQRNVTQVVQSDLQRVKHALLLIR